MQTVQTVQTSNTKALRSFTVQQLTWGLSLIDLELSKGKFSLFLDQAKRLAIVAAPNKEVAKAMLEIAGCFTLEEVRKELLRRVQNLIPHSLGNKTVNKLETLPQSLHRAYLCTLELKTSQALLLTAFSESDKKAYEHNVSYWKKSVAWQICQAFKMDNNLKFADLNSLADGDELITSVIRLALRGTI